MAGLHGKYYEITNTYILMKSDKLIEKGFLMLIDNEHFLKRFNSKIFENSKIELLSQITDYTERYIGIFRPTKPKMKIIQNITQSHEIRFGDAMEIIIAEYFEKSG